MSTIPALPSKDSETFSNKIEGLCMIHNLKNFYYASRYEAKNLLNKAIIHLIILMAPTFCYSEPKVFFLGDSITHGFGLPEDEGLINQLSNWFSNNDITVDFINGGVSGDTTAGGLERLSWSLTEDISAVVVALGSNDVLRGFPPEITKENLSAIIDIAQSNKLPVLLIGTYAPGNYGQEYKSDFDAIFIDLAEEKNIAYIDSYLKPLLDEVSKGKDVMHLLQADGLHPNLNGVQVIVEYVFPQLLKFLQETNIIE
jgi:acyl-CoA thioesterase-1